MRIKNLTPHPIKVYTGRAVMATYISEGSARACQATERVGTVDGLPLVSMTYGEPVGLPDPEPGVYLIVSALTAQAAKAHGRPTDDLLLTALPVRNDAGQIIGCQAFARI